MAAIANVLANDFAQPTPVEHTFSPAKTSADYAQWEDRSATSYIGFNKLTFSMTRPQGAARQANRNLRLNIKLETPIMETLGNSSTGLTPPPTVAYRLVMELNATLPERCSLQERQNLFVMFRNVINAGGGPASKFIENYEVPF